MNSRDRRADRRAWPFRSNQRQTFDDIEDIAEWCAKVIGPENVAWRAKMYGPCQVHFKRQSDLVLYKLRWE